MCDQSSLTATLSDSVAHQPPLSMEFSRQKYWSGLPFLSAGDLPDPGVETVSLAAPVLAGRFFTPSTSWEAPIYGYMYLIFIPVAGTELFKNLRIS